MSTQLGFIRNWIIKYKGGVGVHPQLNHKILPMDGALEAIGSH
jgi:hypothetical protein